MGRREQVREGVTEGADPESRPPIFMEYVTRMRR